MLATERIVTFTEAPDHLPRVGGKKIHSSAVWRWARKGIRGVRLECRRIGGRFVTSVEALERFTKALAEVDPSGGSPCSDGSLPPNGRTGDVGSSQVGRVPPTLTATPPGSSRASTRPSRSRPSTGDGRTPAQRAADIARAEQVLRDAGI